MNFNSILAVSDFTVNSEHALERAALLAQQHQSTLRLVFHTEDRHPYLAHPVARLEQRARQLGRRYNVVVHAVQKTCSIDELLEEAKSVDLLVMGPLTHRHWKRFHKGTTLDQAVHGSTCPLLVVRRQATRMYERVLVSIDLSPQSSTLIDIGHRLCRPSQLRLFHAIDTVGETKLRSADASQQAIQAYRVSSRQNAKERLATLADTMDRRDHPVTYDVGHGDPAYSAALQQHATRAELIVVGKRRLSAWERIVTGSVAQRLVKWAEGDVLVAPFERFQAT